MDYCKCSNDCSSQQLLISVVHDFAHILNYERLALWMSSGPTRTKGQCASKKIAASSGNRRVSAKRMCHTIFGEDLSGARGTVCMFLKMNDRLYAD